MAAGWAAFDLAFDGSGQRIFSTPSWVAGRLCLLGAREGYDEALLSIDATN